jgi:hypothetical protein
LTDVDTGGDVQAIELICGQGAAEDFEFYRKHNTAIMRYSHGIMTMQGAPLDVLDRMAADPRSVNGWTHLLREHPEDVAVLRAFMTRLLTHSREIGRS